MMAPPNVSPPTAKGQCAILGIYMMGYGYSGSMMGGFGGLGIITWLVVTVDLILLGIWLWQQISKK